MRERTGGSCASRKLEEHTVRSQDVAEAARATLYSFSRRDICCTDDSVVRRQTRAPDAGAVSRPGVQRQVFYPCGSKFFVHIGGIREGPDVPERALCVGTAEFWNEITGRRRSDLVEEEVHFPCD